MDLINFINIGLYIAIAVLSVILYRKGLPAPAIILGTLALHGFIFNGVYVYRDLLWETCPPVCGLQHWSTALRMHSLIAIVLTMLYRVMVRL